MKEVAVGGVNLDEFEARRQGAPGRVPELAADVFDVVRVHGARGRIAFGKGPAADADRLPTAGGRRDGFTAFPGGGGRTLPTRVGELNAGRGAMFRDKAHDPAPGVDVIVFPYSRVGGR